MDKYKYVNRIVLEAEEEFASPPTLNVDSHYNDPFDLDRVSHYTHKIAAIQDIDLSCWTIKFEYDYTARFKKVSAVVGDDLARHVLDALDGQT